MINCPYLHQDKEKIKISNIFEMQDINLFLYEIKAWKTKRLQKKKKNIVPFHSIEMQNEWCP